jgi:hypothetical protein
MGARAAPGGTRTDDSPTNSKESDMTNFLLAYTGGSTPEGADAQAAVMAAWESWLAGLGAAVVTPGNPFGASASIAPDGGVSDGGRSALTGFSILQADSLAAATTLAKDCPVFTGGGAVEVYEALEM